MLKLGRTEGGGVSVGRFLVPDVVRSPGLVLGVGLGLGDDVAPVESDGVDFVLDDVAGVGGLDFLQKDVGVKLGGEIAHLYLEVGLVEYQVGRDLGVGGAEAVFQIKGSGFAVVAREGGYLDAETGNGLYAVVEFYVFLHQLLYLHVAYYLYLAGLFVGVALRIGYGAAQQHCCKK